jgi:hypothetical protein
MPKTGKNTTITLPRKEYDKLCKFKDELGKREEFSWVSALGVGAFVGFVVGLAAIGANREVFTCVCGKQIDLTGWKEDRFQCPSCGREHNHTVLSPKN